MGKYTKPKRYNFKTAEVRFEFDKSFYPIVGNGGFEFCDGYSILHVTRMRYVDDINFYVHELSEIALLSAMRKCTRRWRTGIKFKNFKFTDLSHLLAPYGYPNKQTLFPDPTIKTAYKKFLRTLSKEERRIRSEMGSLEGNF